MNNNVITIVTATYNAGKYLEKCLNSIIPQLNNEVELIIIDGGSKDNTIDIIKKYQNHISHFVSEPDKGIYDAWNKGIEKASGNWVMFIGADDQLVPDALESYRQFIYNNGGANDIDLISSKVQMIDENGKTIRIKGWPFLWPMFLKEMTIAHPGALHAKKLFEKYGNYDINYKIVGDYELLLRGKDSLKTLYLDKVSVIMSEGGASDSVKSIKEQYKAVVSTGKQPKYLAFINIAIIYCKFKIKKSFRKIGLNLYLRKSY
ncbi:glycosyltransferase family 2 protein [Flavobacterium limi]|uniref:Glycosyl transferase n=1 Tax=Flavobacterium limi TaxID=2045105 RepID=A0ABQ1U7I4_9FLAO|nr:glycosyltransferase family 2 protein [Flavobacterium limi]GGF12559.1 glycosyl transferase [Flavobacterium limi]